MRNTLALVLLVLLGGCNGMITFPAIEHLSQITPIPQTAITNGTPYFTRLVVYGTEIGTLSPGSVLYGNRWEVRRPQVPVTARFYRDPGYQEYVGSALRIFYQGSASIESWTIRESEIFFKEGTREPWIGVLPPLNTVRVRFPEEPYGTTVIQLTNHSHYRLLTRVNGRDRLEVDRDGFYALGTSLVLGYAQDFSLVLVFKDDQGRSRGVAERRFPLPGPESLAYQWVVTDSDIVR